MGSSWAQTYYSRRTGVNTWSAAVQVSAGGTADFTTPEALLGASDIVHFNWKDITAGKDNQRALSSANVLQTASTPFGNAGGLGQGVSYNNAGTQKIIVGGDDNATSFFSIRYDSANTPTINTAASGASVDGPTVRLFNDGTTAWALYRETTSSDLIAQSSTDNGATFGSQFTAFTATVTAGAASLSIDGNIFTRGSSVVIPYVVNDNGTLKYNEYVVRTLTAAFGWDSWDAKLQPPRRKHERAAAAMIGDSGAHAVFIPPAPPTPPWIDHTPIHQHPRPERSAAVIKEDDGIAATQINFVAHGWPVQPPQPPHPRREKWAAIIDEDDGIELPEINFFAIGWPIQNPQPPHPRPERTGAVAKGNDGNEGIFVLSTAAPVNFDSPFPQPPAQPRQNRAAATMRGNDGTDAAFTQFFPVGWPAVLHQPNHPRPERAGAIARGDDGNAVPFQFWRNAGGEVQPWQPPMAPRPSLRGASFPRGDDGNAGVFQQWVNAGWEVQPVQPPHQRPERAGSIAEGDDGAAGTLINFYPQGWSIQEWQPPHPHAERSGALARGHDGDDDVFRPPTTTPSLFESPAFQLPNKPGPNRAAAVMEGDDGAASPFAQFFAHGWPVIPPQPPHPRPERATSIMRGDDGSQGTFQAWRNAGWEVQPPQPPHRRTEKAGGILEGIDGIDAAFRFSFPFLWPIDFEPYHVRVERWAALAKGDDGIQAGFARWFNAGWEVQPPPPPHPRPERSGALARGNDGIDQVRINFFPVWPIVDFQIPHLRPERAGALMRGDDGAQNTFTFIVVPITWWEIQPLMPRVIGERRSAILRGDDGTADLFRRFFDAGWPVQPWQPPRRRWERVAGILRGDDGTAAQFYLWQNVGWEVQAVQPPHRAPELKGAAFLRGDDGNQGRFAQFYPHGWFVHQPQPPHPRPERGGAPLAGDSGIAAPFVPAGTFPTAWGLPFEPAARRITRTLADRDDGIASPYRVWRNHGFDPQPPQPPRRRPVDAGPWAWVDLTAPATPAITTFGWFVHPVQPGHPRPERAGSLAGSDPGTASPFSQFRPYGWPVQPPQPPHPKPERFGTLARGDDQGTNRPFSRWFNAGWEVQHWQPPHRRPEVKHAALARGDDGFAAPFVYWRVAGWEIQSWQPPHFAPGYRYGALARGDDGVEGTFRRSSAFVALSLTTITAYSSMTLIAGWGSATMITQRTSLGTTVTQPESETSVVPATSKTMIT